MGINGSIFDSTPPGVWVSENLLHSLIRRSKNDKSRDWGWKNGGISSKTHSRIGTHHLHFYLEPLQFRANESSNEAGF